MLRPCPTAHFGQPSVGKVDFRLLVCRREWVQCGLRCVVMREGCDGLLIGSSQVVAWCEISSWCRGCFKGSRSREVLIGEAV